MVKFVQNLGCVAGVVPQEADVLLTQMINVMSVVIEVTMHMIVLEVAMVVEDPDAGRGE